MRGSHDDETKSALSALAVANRRDTLYSARSALNILRDKGLLHGAGLPDGGPAYQRDAFRPLAIDYLGNIAPTRRIAPVVGHHESIFAHTRLSRFLGFN